jgi:hypothetical protein
VEKDFKKNLVDALKSEYPNITEDNIVIIGFSKGSTLVNFIISWSNDKNVDAI